MAPSEPPRRRSGPAPRAPADREQRPRRPARPKRQKPTGRPRGLWRWRRWLVSVALCGFAVIAGGLYYLSQIPLPAPKPLTQTTFVYDNSGHVLAEFSQQNRVLVSLNRVPQVVINAVVSTEDRHFFTEGALNPVSILRAVVA